jgi:membrane protein DedA with SNARE-associated domain
MDFIDQPIFQYLVQYAYQPELVYLAVVGMMFASGFGLPIPEEVTLLSLGWLTFMGSRPDLFPPPPEGGTPINMHHAAIVAFLAVVGADFLIFSMGRKWGRKLLYHPRLARAISRESIEKVENWTKKYGSFAAFIFRFTPGVRFPGHLACGSMGMSPIKFFAVDCFAALISVPTQIYLVAIYGEPIFEALKEVKIVIFSLLGIALVVYLGRKLFLKFRSCPG